MTVIDPQFERRKSPGPTLSFICAVPEFPDVRLTPVIFPKLTHWFAGKTLAPFGPRSIPASPNSFTPRVSLDGATVSETVVLVFTLASANPRSVRSVAVPQQGAVSLLISHGPEVTQRRNVMCGLSVAPPSKS